MKASLALFGTLALVPAMTGPLPATGNPAGLVLPLCGEGASATVPVETPPLPGTGQTPCCAKGCQTGQKRKRIDKAQ